MTRISQACMLLASLSCSLAQGPDPRGLEQQLAALGDEIEAGTSVAAHLRKACNSAEALAPCEEWGVGLAGKVIDRGNANSRRAVVGVINLLREMRHQLLDPQSENVELLIARGEVEVELPDYRNARSVLDQARDILERSEPDGPLMAITLQTLAASLQEVGDLPYKEKLLRRELAIRKKLNGELHMEVAASYCRLGDFLQDMDRGEEAEAAFREALRTAEELDPKGIVAAAALNSLGDLMHTRKSLEEAKGFYERALGIVVRREGARSPNAATCMDNLAGVYSDQDNLVEALRKRVMALEILRQTLGSDDPTTITVTNNLGSLYYRRGDFKSAEECYRETLRLRKKLLPAGHFLIAQSESFLANALVAQGRLLEAEPLYVAALASRESSLGPGHPETSDTRCALGLLYLARGATARAEPLLTMTLSAREQKPGPNHAETAQSLAALARLYTLQGALKGAARYYLRALAIYENTYGSAHRNTITTLSNLAEIRRLQKDYKGAELLYLEARQNAKKLLPPRPYLSADLDENLALLRSDQGDLIAAQELYRSALDVRLTVLGPAHPDVALSRFNLANVLARQGDRATADRLYTEALSGLENALGSGHPYLAAVRIHSAQNLWASGRGGAARDYLLAANRSVSSFWSGNLAEVEDERRRSIVRTFDDLLPVSLSVAEGLVRDDPRGASELAALALATRKGVRSSATEEIFAHIRREQNPDTLELFRQLQINSEMQSHAIGLPDPRATTELKKLREAESELEKELIARSSGYHEWRQMPEPDTIAATLTANSALVDIVRYTRRNPVTGKSDGTRYVAVVYRREVGARLVPLGPAAPIDQAVVRLRLNFENMWRACTPNDHCSPGVSRILIAGNEFERNVKRTEQDCVALYRLTMLRLSPAVDGVRRLILSPDARLAEIPWEILRDHEGPHGRYMIERGYAISYQGSARNLLRPISRSAPESPIAVIAQVDYDGISPHVASNADNSTNSANEERPAGRADPLLADGWKPLRGGHEILETIRELHRQGLIGPYRKLPLGSEEELMALRRPKALIVHTHGFFREICSTGTSGNDGLLSGIILYGANRAGDPRHRRRDGWLTAKEVTLLNLDATQLVALLGCDTGRGVEAGEGVQGLRHALEVAGARSTLLTLWQVGDISVARFLRELLVRIATEPGNAIEHVLVQVRLAFLRGEIREANASAQSSRWRHPYFWAAATLGGPGGAIDLSR